MESEVGKWGNSLAVRLPKSVAREAGVEYGAPVDISLESGRIVIAPRARKYELKDLLKAVKPGNLHEAIDTGPPVGREAW